MTTTPATVRRPVEYSCGHTGTVDDDGYMPGNPWVLEHPLPCRPCDLAATYPAAADWDEVA